MTLRARLTSAAALVVVVSFFLGLFLIHSVETAGIRQVDQQLAGFLPSKPFRIATSSGPTSRPAHSPPVFSTNNISALYLATITNGKRTVLSTPLGTKRESPRTPSTASTSRKNVTIVTVGSTSGSQTWRAVLVAFPHSHSDILVAASLSQVNATTRFLELALLVTGLIILAVLFAAGLWIVRLGLRPITEVTAVAEAIAKGDRTQRVAKGSQRTEAGKLTRAFNVMLDEQQALEARLRQFVGDASHELRTPVSAILGITDLWRRGELRSGEVRDEAIHRIGVSSRQMGRLVEDLLLLARLDEGRPLEYETVDLESVVREVVADVLVTSPTREVTISAPHKVVVEGDEARLRQVVVNLITNAVRHTPPEAKIQVRVLEEGEGAVLEVEDAGPGMTQEDAQRAFDRFWQADPSRSRAGAGLGLAIVRSIVDAHCGDISLISNPLTGTRVTVTIPQRPPVTDKT